MAELNLNDKFPDLQPIRKAPPLMRVNGCGVGIYGARDHDEETGTYVTTHCLCIVFIPVLGLAAYRVARAPSGGYYFIGREPLSATVRVFNALVLLLAVGLGVYFAWSAHTTSPAFVAQHKLADADRLAKAGDYALAAQQCREVALGQGQRAMEAAQRLDAYLDAPAVRRDPKALLAVVQAAVAAQERGRWLTPPEVLFKRGMERTSEIAQANPQAALDLLDAVAPLAPRSEDLDAVRRDLLTRLVAAHPDDIALLSQLAAVYERQNQPEKIQSLLEPHRAALGTSEGARILGLLDARAGRTDAALALLRPYVKAGIDRLKVADGGLSAAIESAQQRVLDELKGPNRPSDFNAKHYKSLDQVAQRHMVTDYIMARIKDDPSIADARQRVMREAAVAAAAQDLGMILLHRAQGQTDPEAKKADLAQAEATLLAIGQIAGESHEYRMTLGQVYYWQGKHREGRGLLDEALKATNRSPKTLLQVARILREVGGETEARPLAEEAYKKSTDPQIQSAAASLRGHVGTDLDDRIAWLRRVDAGNSANKASLDWDLAEQAIERGRDDEAANYLREAIGIYASLPETTTSLNNGGLARVKLASITGDNSEFDRGVTMIEKAIALNPSDSVAMINAAEMLLEGMLRDIAGRSIDLKLLRRAAGVDLIEFLFHDAAGQDEVVARLRAHQALARTRNLLEKGTLLAPRREREYAILAWLASFLRDSEAMSSVVAKLEQADLDQGTEIVRAKDRFAGKRDEEDRKENAAQAARAEKILEAARAQGLDLTFAVAAHSLNSLRMAGGRLGLPADADSIVALAEEARKAAPCKGTRSGLIGALAFRAETALRSDPAYAALVEQTRRSLNASERIAFVLDGPEPLRRTALENADVRRILGLVRESSQATPRLAPYGWAWAMLHASEPDAAKAVTENHAHDELAAPAELARAKLAPMSETVVLEAYWLARMQGKEEDAAAVLKAYADRGVPLPAAPKSVEGRRDATSQ